MSQIERFRDTPQIAYIQGKSGRWYQVPPLMPGALEQIPVSHVSQPQTGQNSLAVGLFCLVGSSLFVLTIALIAYGMGRSATSPVVVQPAPPAICRSGVWPFIQERRC